MMVPVVPEHSPNPEKRHVFSLSNLSLININFAIYSEQMFHCKDSKKRPILCLDHFQHFSNICKSDWKWQLQILNG